jgi:glycosyl transferase family 25
MESALNHVGMDYEIIDAVDGRDIDLDDPAVLASGTLSMLPRWKQPNAVGCALSHLAACRRILDQRQRSALILEDDVQLSADVGVVAEEVARLLGPAEVALLTYRSRTAPCLLRSEGALSLPGSRLLADPVNISQLGCAAAYVITYAACNRMLAHFPPVRVAADSWSFFQDNAVFDRLRCVAPMPVNLSDAFRSTIGHSPPGTPKAYFSDLLDHTRFPPVRRLLSTRRRKINDSESTVEFVPRPSSSNRPER